MIRKAVRMLRDSETGRFLKKAGGWTDRVQEAAKFLTLREIVRACEQLGLSSAEIVYERTETFGSRRSDFELRR